jgi:sigma-E factor negative regulatory protein RseC
MTDIKHKGRISQIKDGKLVITFPRSSACAGCHAKGACLMSDTQEMQVFVDDDGANRKVGDEVTVLIERQSGLKAVLLAYIIPLILLLITMSWVLNVTGSDLYAGLSALSILVPYYIIIYILRKKLGNEFKVCIL